VQFRRESLHQFAQNDGKRARIRTEERSAWPTPGPVAAAAAAVQTGLFQHNSTIAHHAFGSKIIIIIIIISVIITNKQQPQLYYFVPATKAQSLHGQYGEFTSNHGWKSSTIHNTMVARGHIAVHVVQYGYRSGH
jgi:hypothetical protein